MSPSLQIADVLQGSAAQTLGRACEYLLKQRSPEGSWWGAI